MWCHCVPEYTIRMNHWKIIHLFTHNAVCCPVTLSLLLALCTPNTDQVYTFPDFCSVLQIVYHDCFFAKLYYYLLSLTIWWPIPVAAQSKAWVCGHSLAGIGSSNPAGVWMSVSCTNRFCVFSGRWANHSSRGVLPIVVSECDRVAL